VGNGGRTAGCARRAEQNLGDALADAEDDADLLNSIAMLAYRRQQFSAARALVDRALRCRDADPRLWFNYGLACAAGGDAGEARAAFERVLTMSPAHDGAARWLAKLQQR
jgi:Flp pilus assembly protein TadD